MNPRLAWALASLAALAVPLAVKNPYYLTVAGSAYIGAISAYGLNVMLGETGLLNLGHAAFFGVGAYTLALLETKLGVPFALALPAAILASAVFGVLVGIISLRTRGHYFAIFTAAVGVMVAIVFSTWQELTNGNIGISAIPPPPRLGAISFDDPAPKYYLALVALGLTIGVTALVRRSLFGRALVAIRGNEALARATGIDVTRTTLAAFALSTAIAGFAGAMFAVFVGFLGPESSSTDATFETLLDLVVGGAGTLAGPLAGTLLLTLATQELQAIEQFRFLIFGPLLVALMIFFPGGIAGTFGRLRRRRAQRGDAAVAPVREAAPS